MGLEIVGDAGHRWVGWEECDFVFCILVYLCFCLYLSVVNRESNQNCTWGIATSSFFFFFFFHVDLPDRSSRNPRDCIR